MTVIRGSLEALCDRIVTEPQEVEDYHRQMLAETLFLQRLINDLLDLSRLQNTDFPIEKEPVNLCDVVQDVVRSSQRLGQQKILLSNCPWTRLSISLKAIMDGCGRCC